MCSTPFGITASGTGCVGERTARRRCVLNAFRHHGERDYRELQADELAKSCSTPFGITASGTTYGKLWPVERVMCSTPFGITASGTPPGTAGVVLKRVLNAFRHHGERDDSKPGVLGHWEEPVLNAFRHHGERDRTCSRSSRRSPSAQRLSASRRAGQVISRGPSRGEVLNAFRHHGERDHAGGRGVHQQHQVLNAFRHHGERDQTLRDRGRLLSSCSTPFGITASGTARLNPPVIPAPYKPLFKHLPLLPPGWPSQALPRIPNPMKSLGFSSIMHLFTCQRASTP